LAHYLVGLIIVLKGIEKADHFSEHPLICMTLFFIGGFILFANFRHHLFEKHFKEFNVVLFLCEGVVLVIISIYYFSEGKKAIPYLYLLAAIVYLVMAVRLYRKKPSTETTDIKEVSVPAVPEPEEIQVGE
jgi:predicted membrane channel-forming protein YqfA (hemolysin III family)